MESDRLNGAIVEILNASNTVLTCYTIGDEGNTKIAFSFGCCNPYSGQKVRIRKLGNTEFNFAGMQVWTVLSWKAKSI